MAPPSSPPDRYAPIVAEARRQVLALSLEQVCAASGARLAPASVVRAQSSPAGQPALHLPVLDRELRMELPEGELAWPDGAAPGTDYALVSLHYLARAAGPLATEALARYGGLPGAAAYAGAFEARAEQPLAAYLDQDFQRLTEAADTLGTRRVDGLWEFRFFPYLPLVVRLAPAEGPLPFACVILFSRRAGYLHHVEDLAVVGQLLAERLLELTSAGSR